VRGLDFSSWQALLSTVVGLAVITLIAVGIRLLVMQTVQQRRERENRQVNERLKTLISGYKTLGGSFTGNLTVDPTHFRELQSLPAEGRPSSSDRSRRVRDAVEGALSDVILLGTEEQVRLAAQAAAEMAAGRAVHTAELVVSLRNFIREVLDLDAVPDDVLIPKQGPARSTGSKPKDDRGRDDAKQGGKNLAAGGGSGGGGFAGGMGAGGGYSAEDSSESHDGI
jgi:type II secretory pathway pseudopilin PulG